MRLLPTDLESAGCVGARSEVEKDFVGVELACRTVFQGHFDAVRIEEPGASTHEVDAGGSEELLMRRDHR